MVDFLQVMLGVTLLLIVICFVWKRPVPIFENLQGKHVLITGGSSGIGLEIAKEVLAQGCYATLVARNRSRLLKAVEEILEEVKCNRDRIDIKVADVSDYRAVFVAVNEAFEWKPIDILVCNAGLAYSSYLDKMHVEEIDLTIGTNLTGTVYTLNVALPLMKQRSNLHPSAVVLMGSLSSMYVLYGHALYTATKYAMRGLAEALRLELLPFNIKVTHVCPGFVDTPMLRNIEGEVPHFPVFELPSSA
ncbi:3-dehydrosphinganine reductase TSC10B-like [Cryptomeria japonica]|uniref:3-dehydrosphinganine reductase TSC10B-like n=1 Tax=Cryptomeria japonica TaxID=3369 RepID=UPI0025AB8AD0|nr:3-dehydrosphinganine reductase TSC10B-like [Cryptomeria japonica]